MRTTCELIVSMVTERMISHSVTLTLAHLDLDLFLNSLYDTFVDAILRSISSSSSSSLPLKRVQNHILFITNLIFLFIHRFIYFPLVEYSSI